MRLVPIVLALAGCGPRTLWSSVFPTEYNVTVTVNAPETWAYGYACRVVDQRDSIAANMSTSMTGELPFIAGADGSLLIFGSFSPCRWFPGKDFPPVYSRWELIPTKAERQRKDVERFNNSESYRFDNAYDPHQLDVLHTHALWAELGATASLTFEAALPPLRLRGAFPWLDTLDAQRAAERAAYNPRSREDPGISAGVFYGVEARATQLWFGATCDAPDQDAPVIVPVQSECRYLQACSSYKPGRPCSTEIGGMRPRYSADRQRADFTTEDIETTLGASMLRGDELKAAGAPFPRRRGWAPEICLDGMCYQPDDPLLHTLVYYPRRRLLVQVHYTSNSVESRSLVLGPPA